MSLKLTHKPKTFRPRPSTTVVPTTIGEKEFMELPEHRPNTPNNTYEDALKEVESLLNKKAPENEHDKKLNKIFENKLNQRIEEFEKQKKEKEAKEKEAKEKEEEIARGILANKEYKRKYGKISLSKMLKFVSSEKPVHPKGGKKATKKQRKSRKSRKTRKTRKNKH